jgi:hypothetical protein
MRRKNPPVNNHDRDRDEEADHETPPKARKTAFDQRFTDYGSIRVRSRRSENAENVDDYFEKAHVIAGDALRLTLV